MDVSFFVGLMVGFVTGLLAGIIAAYACVSIGLEDERLEGHTWGSDEE